MTARRLAIKSKRAKERQGQRLKKTAVFIVIVITFIIGGISWVFHNENILINDIRIEGAQSVDSEVIIKLVEENISGKYFWIFPKKNIFIFPKNKLETDVLDKYKQIKTITLKRDSFNVIKINILEREPFALWCDSERIVNEEKEGVGNCYFVDYEGYIYATAPYFYDNIYFELYGEPFIDNDEIVEKTKPSSAKGYSVAKEEEKPADAKSFGVAKEELNVKITSDVEYIGKYFLPPVEFVQTMQFISSLKKIEISAYSLIIDSPNMYKLTLVSGGVLRFLPELDYHRVVNDLKTAYEKKFSENSELLPKDLEYIDIRFDNKILFKFKD